MELTDVHVYVDAYISSHSTLLKFLVSSWLLCTWFPDFYWAIICNVLTTNPTLPLLKQGCWSLYVWGVWIWFYLDIRPFCMWGPLVVEEILREKPCEGRGQDWSVMGCKTVSTNEYIIWPTKEAESRSDLRSGRTFLTSFLSYSFKTRLYTSPSSKVLCFGDFM